MKTKFILALLFFATISVKSQMSCCGKISSTEMFAGLTQDKEFVAAHLEPLPFILEDPKGKNIAFKTPDGKEGFAYELKNKKATNKYVFVIHEWWGLNDYVKQESEKIAANLGDVNVIALDLYDKKVATTRDSAGKYMGAVTSERASAIIKGALEYVGKDAQITTIGWCFGGGWSLQTSILAEKQSKACVMYYGMPEEKTEKLSLLQAPVFFVWPEQDKWINKEVLGRFEKNMKDLDKSLIIKAYKADHAFANPSNPKYSKEFADEAFLLAMQFMKDNFK
jgi:carboxymethylenebutenolidase